jgi:hypothetical protein
VQWRHRCAPLSLPHFCAPIPARFLRRIDQQRASNSQRIPAGAYSPKAPIRRQSGEIRHGCEASVNPILLANWYGTESGGDLAPCTQRLPRAPGRYRSLYRTVLRIREQYPACRSLTIEEFPTAPRSPFQNEYTSLYTSSVRSGMNAFIRSLSRSFWPCAMENW